LLYLQLHRGAREQAQMKAFTTRRRNLLKIRLLSLLALLCPEFRGHQSIETASKRAQAMLAITPQEFLF
jgi:hypothetical protein